MHRTAAIVAAVLLAGSALFVNAGSAVAASITPTPSTVGVGGTVRLRGDVLVNGTPGCAVPGEVTLLSPAFQGLGEFAGVAAVTIPVDGSGRFDGSITLQPTVAPGTYSITGRCGGGNMGITATLVVALPATGAPGYLPLLGVVAASLVFAGTTLLALRRFVTRSPAL